MIDTPLDLLACLAALHPPRSATVETTPSLFQDSQSTMTATVRQTTATMTTTLPVDFVVYSQVCHFLLR